MITIHSQSILEGRDYVIVGCDRVGPYRVPELGGAGLPAGLDLCPSGPIRVTVPGSVLDGWDVRGGIVIDAPDVVLLRSRATGDRLAPYGVRTTSAGSVRIEDTTFTGDFPEAAIGGDRWTGERVRIVATGGDGAHLGVGSRLRNSRLPDAATDVPGGRVVISGNTLAGGRHTLHEAAAGLPEVWLTGNRFERDAGQGPLRCHRARY
ncbi:MAG: hypothetical protein LH603_00380 [Pseudonocardia sp.]|nr:hypothetical protein [Pseudonocardia sp.]